MEVTVTQARLETRDLARLWTQAQPSVAAFVYALVPSFHDSEDILQNVASTLVDKIDQYDPARPFLPWAIGVARYEVLRHQQSRGRDRHVFGDEVLERLEQACAEVGQEQEWLKEALDNCLRHLEGRSRKLLEFRYLHDLKPRRIAQQLGLTDNSVRVMLHRIRSALRRCIERRMAQWRAQ